MPTKLIEALQQIFPTGTRILLDKAICDVWDQVLIPEGAKATVVRVEQDGTLKVSWDDYPECNEIVLFPTVDHWHSV